MTPARRSALVSLSDGGWRVLGEHHSATVISWLVRQGYIRDDMSYGRIAETEYTITPDGIESLRVSA